MVLKLMLAPVPTGVLMKLDVLGICRADMPAGVAVRTPAGRLVSVLRTVLAAVVVIFDEPLLLLLILLLLLFSLINERGERDFMLRLFAFVAAVVA